MPKKIGFVSFHAPNAAHPEGRGVGLAFGRSVARFSGGTATCVSEIGQGSTFAVVLPLKGLDGAAGVRALPMLHLDGHSAISKNMSHVYFLSRSADQCMAGEKEDVGDLNASGARRRQVHV